MAYQAIYRKWRPITFEDVVGQSHITDTLKNELKTNRTAHAYLFCGTRGTGKTTTAKILSRALNCEHLTENGNPCNECATCKGILNNTIMDVVEIDAASNNSVDYIRELRDEVSYTPANAKYKVYIIDEVHMLSSNAFNALLKTLEEPPAHVIFILATTEPHKVLQTIQSRCQRFDFKRISIKNIAGRIGEITRKDGINISQDAIRLVAELGDGSMRDALSILDLCVGIEGEITLEDIESVTGAVSRTKLRELSASLMKGDISSSVKAVNKMLENGREVNTLIEELIMTFREIMMCKIMDNPAEIIDKYDDEIEEYKALAQNTSAEQLIHITKVLSETASICKNSTNPRVMLEASIVKICDPAVDTSTEAFAARVAKLEAMMLTGFKPASATETKPIAEEPKEQPPFEVEEIKTEEDEEYVSDCEEYVEEDVPFDLPPMPEPSVEPTPTEQPKAESTDNSKIITVLEAIKTQLPPLYMVLKDAKITVNDDVCNICFANSLVIETIKINDAFQKTLKESFGVSRLKLTSDEAQNTTDALDDFDIMSKDMDQVTFI